MLLLALLEGHSKLIFEPVMVAMLLVIHIAVVKVCFMLELIYLLKNIVGVPKNNV